VRQERQEPAAQLHKAATVAQVRVQALTELQPPELAEQVAVLTLAIPTQEQERTAAEMVDKLLAE
jgi:hypothetical protein